MHILSKLTLILTLFSCGLYADVPWTFTKIRGKGSFFSKERYLQHYLIEPGDRFDLSKHKLSLTKMVDVMKAEGYLKARITDEINYDKASKTVSVAVRFEPGSRYIIDSVQVKLDQYPELRNELQKKAEKTLAHAIAEKDRIAAATDEMTKYLAKKGYAGATIQSHLAIIEDKKNRATLSFVVTLVEKKEYLFTGNSFFTSDQLLDEILLVQEQGLSLPDSLIAEDIEALYRAKGFLAAHVDVNEKPGIVTFLIHEGERYKVGTVSKALTGDHPADLSVKEIVKKLKHDLESLPVFDQEQIDERRFQAAQELTRLGYWDAHIEVQMKPIRAKKQDIVLDIHLGNKRMIQNIIIVDHPEFLKEGLFKRWVCLKVPQSISPQEIDEQRRWLQKTFAKRGYLNAKIAYDIQILPSGSTLEWKIDISQGPVRFGRTVIAGLKKMKPYIVERELRYHEGEVWSREKIDESIKRLRDLCMFETISITPLSEEPANSQFQPVLIKCIEDDPFEIRTRLGFQFVSKSFTHVSWSTFRLGGSFLWKNPAGIADRLTLDADLSWYTRNLAIGYEVPWIGPLPVRTLFRVYSDQYDQPLISSKQRLYKESHDGVSVSFKHSHPWWHGCFKFGIELDKLSCIAPELAHVIDFEPTLVNHRTPYLYFEPIVTFEHFDNKVDPCKGFSTIIALKAMVPPGVRDGWFIKAVFEQSFYYPLYRSLIGAVRWRVGHIFNPQFNTILPTERFYLGGCSTLRGYEPNMVPPLNDLVCDNCRIFVPVGGKSMANINTELRFPLYQRLSGVVFTDMGALAQDKFADIKARWVGATGFGVRFATPVGPVRFDIGWKWKKRNPEDKRYAWFLTLGHAF